MNKSLLTLAISLCSVLSFAQKKGVVTHDQIEILGSNLDAPYKTSALQCDTLFNFNIFVPTTTVTVYSLNTSGSCPTGGYVVGNNCYGDVEKANYYVGNYNALLSPSVTSCYTFLYRNPTSGKGTKGIITNTMGINVYYGNMTTGPSGAAIGSTSASMGSIVSVFSSTSSIGRYPFHFTNPVPLNGSGFFVSAVLPKNTGDTAVIFAQLQAATTSGWDRASDYSWFEMKSSWGGTYNFELCMFPVLGCSGFAGITENDLEFFFKIIPNPSSGVFTVLSTVSNLSHEISVTDILGKEIYKIKKEEHDPASEIDLSARSKGVYFIKITSANKSIVKKVIID